MADYPFLTSYAVGTVSVENGGTTVTGSGTFWVSSDPNQSPIRAGDLFGTHVGLAIRIESVVDGTELLLAHPWPGDDQIASAYEIQLTPRVVGVQEATRQLFSKLGNGNLTAFSELIGAADLVPIFTGAGTIGLVPRSSLISGAAYDVQVDDLPGRAVYDASAQGFSVLVSDIGDGSSAIYSKRSAASGDWTDPAVLTGVGPAGPYTQFVPGDTVTLNPGQPATVTFTEVSPGVFEIDFGVPRGANGTGTGDVVGPSSATDGYFPRFSGSSGKLLGEGTTFGTTAGSITEGNDGRLNNNAKLNVEDQTLTGGARVTSKDLGTITTGTVTPDPGDRPLQHYINNGAHTLSPGANGGSYMLDITNGASAGAITLSGWTKTAGDAFTTTSGHKFRLHCSVGNGGSLLIIQAMQ